MLNRRHIRIKVLQVLFAYYNDDEPNAASYEKMLFDSVNRFRDLYVAFIQLMVEMHSLSIEKIEAGMNKKLPSHEDLHPNTKFAANSVLRILSHSKSLEKATKENHLKWTENRDLLKQMFKDIQECSEYQEYLASEVRGFEHDKEIVVKLFKRHLVNFELMHDYLEEQGIFWNDDIDLTASMVLRTLKAIKESDTDIEFLPLWKEGDEEEEFCRQLFRKTLSTGADTKERVALVTPNWETDRIAIMDLVLLKMAIAEAIYFESIPTKVTMNEYIELAKFYSTPKSATFINGVLDTLMPKMVEEGKIKKVGRGLI
jgi:N utilization substance protein B